jgi:hypothetical protein
MTDSPLVNLSVRIEKQYDWMNSVLNPIQSQHKVQLMFNCCFLDPIVIVTWVPSRASIINVRRRFS